MIKIISNKKIAYDSPDHLNPCGSINDNNSSIHYITEVKNYFNNNKINVLDLGCSGGQIIVDHISLGDLAIGIEGSDTVLKGAGKKNWDKYHDSNLFLSDITENFTIKDDENTILFDVIQMWDVFEHIPEYKIPSVLDNIHKHLKKDGIFLGQISQQIDEIRHISVFERKKWTNLFEKNGFTLEKYIFNNVPRCPLYENSNDYKGFQFLSKKI